MRFLIPIVLFLVSALNAIAGEDADLRHLLSLLSAVQIGDDYDRVKKLLPEVGPLHKDAGENNTEALCNSKAGKITMRGEFNFSKGRLVSHGFATGGMPHSEAHDFLLRCITILEQINGPSERRISLPNDSGDGWQDSIGMSFNWHKNKTVMGLNFNFRHSFATINWGAQAE